MIHRLKEEINNLDTSEKKIKSYAVLFSTILLTAFLISVFYSDNLFFPIIFAVSTVYFAFGFLYTPLLAGLYKIWMVFALILGEVVSTIILFLIFFLVISPVSLVLKLSGKDLLKIKPTENEKTYWSKRSDSYFTKNNFENQF